MNLSPGLVYSCSELLAIASERSISLSELRGSFKSVGVTSSIAAIEFSQRMLWLRTDDAGAAEVTAAGKRLLSQDPIEGRMRQALLDLVEIDQPFWIQNAIHGRRRVLSFVATAIAQVFLEAGLVDGTSPDVTTFWDALAARARGQRDTSMLKIGRTGERLSLAYESRRTGRVPNWIAIDSNADGYDLLSVVASTDDRRLSIEVKTTTVGLSALLHLTRNEWDYAVNAPTHVFHLWDVTPQEPTLAVIDCAEVGKHIPLDVRDGVWNMMTIPFSAFASKMAAQSQFGNIAIPE